MRVLMRSEIQMKTVYTLTVETVVRIPAGTLYMAVANGRTFLFDSVEARQPVLDWVRENDWKHSTSIDHVMSAEEAQDEIRAAIEKTCAHFHHPVPTLVDATYIQTED
jgi:hypothetical protein